jgi:DnaK suppressor protein
MTVRNDPAQALHAQLREALEFERRELLGQVADIAHDAHRASWHDGGFDDDPADTGSANLERDRAKSLSAHARSLLTAIDAALARLDAGAYGTCANCGTEIEPARLEALPYATLCMDCKRREERHR